jgi:hypothetical protein
MLSVYKVFQLIFGTIASIFILAFLLQYTGTYSDIQEQSQSVEILKNFNKVAGDVYLTGNTINYEDFSKFSLGDCFAFFNEPDSPVIKCGSIDYPTYVPMAFHSGDSVLIDASYMDLGWLVNRYILVYPELKIIFNPTYSQEEAASMMRNITSLFNCEWGVQGYACNDINRGMPFPTSLRLEPRVKFGFCDGSDIRMNLCSDPGSAGAAECERFDMFSGPLLYNIGTGWQTCSAQPPSDLYKIVRIEQNCPVTIDRGVCIETSSNGVGRMRVAGSTKTFVYKDPLDIMAFIIGGDKKNALEKPLAETNFIFKNEIMSRRIELSAKIVAKRMELLSSEAADKCCSGQDFSADRCSPLNDLACECGPFFDSLGSILCSDDSSICKLARQDYSDSGRMAALKGRMDSAEGLYREIVARGCENV